MQKFDVTGIKKEVLEEIQKLAVKYGIEQVILFGSRARGDHHPKSDIDLAVRGGNISEFALAVDEETSTLLEYDIIDLSKGVAEALLQSIKKEGIVLYEKI